MGSNPSGSGIFSHKKALNKLMLKALYLVRIGRDSNPAEEEVNECDRYPTASQYLRSGFIANSPVCSPLCWLQILSNLTKFNVTLNFYSAFD